MRRVLTEMEALEREALTRPSPSPRDPWWVIRRRQDELRNDWLPLRVPQPRDRAGRFVKGDRR